MERGHGNEHMSTVSKTFNLCFKSHLDISMRNITLSLEITDNVVCKISFHLRGLPCGN